jgi:hypothetical protein
MPSPGRYLGLLQLGVLGGEPDLGEVQEDQAEDGRGVLLGLEPGVCAKLVGPHPRDAFREWLWQCLSRQVQSSA